MAHTSKPATLGQLKASKYRVLPVKEEMRQNLIRKLRTGEELFPGIIGYEETVIPLVENAILSGQDIVLLGERGQAKTRIARSLVNLLDEEMPAISGCEINDNPLEPDLQGLPDAHRGRGRRARRSTGSRATGATARSWRRRTSPSPIWSARWTRSRSPRGATSRTS